MTRKQTGKAKSDAERQREHRERLSEEGMVRVEVVIPGSDAETMREIAAIFRGVYRAAGTDFESFRLLDDLRAGISITAGLLHTDPNNYDGKRAERGSPPGDSLISAAYQAIGKLTVHDKMELARLMR